MIEGKDRPLGRPTFDPPARSTIHPLDVECGEDHPRSMALRLQRLDPERRRRRLALLVELADAKSLRLRLHPRRLQADRIRELIAVRRRLAD